MPGAESPMSFQVLPSGSSTSSIQSNEFGLISVKRQRVAVPSERADLLDLIADLPTGLALLAAAYWIDPADAPGLNCRIPDA